MTQQSASGWQRETRYAERSPCGRFTVCAIRINGEWTFELWAWKDGKSERMVSRHETAEAARADYERAVRAAETHAA
jgi:hypothetical protein